MKRCLNESILATNIKVHNTWPCRSDRPMHYIRDIGRTIFYGDPRRIRSLSYSSSSTSQTADEDTQEVVQAQAQAS